MTWQEWNTLLLGLRGTVSPATRVTYAPRSQLAPFPPWQFPESSLLCTRCISARAATGACACDSRKRQPLSLATIIWCFLSVPDNSKLPRVS